MKRTILARVILSAVAAAAVAAPVHAGPAGHLVGTWECQPARSPATPTPPIVWFGEAMSDGKPIDTVVDLDAFDGKASGVSDLVSASNGWWKVQPQEGAAFLFKPPVSASAAAMPVKLGASSYECRRLPRTPSSRTPT
jgi:hypothetical protein